MDDPAVERAQIFDVVDLTPVQAGMFFHATSGDVDVYRYQLELDIVGPLDPELLRRCADSLIERHTALRTAYLAEETDDPIGVVFDRMRMPWREVDLGRLPASRRVEECRILAIGERTRPLSLDRAPLIRMLLVRCDDRQWRLVVTNHHIVLDGWSVTVLMRELFTLYARGGDPASIAPARPFRDYLAWLATRDEDSVRTWREALDGLAGPTMVAPGAEVTGQPVRHPVAVDESLSAALTELASARGVTLNTVLQVLWALTLGIETGHPDVVFGTTVSGRPAELRGADAMVGLFINTVPVRVRTEPGQTVGELLDRVQRDQARLLDVQHVALARLHRETGVPALFDTLLVFESVPTDATETAAAETGLTVRPLAATDATHYPLVLVAVPGDPLRVVLKYQPGAIATERAEAIADRFVQVARELTSAASVASLDSLTSAETAELARWNDTGAEVFDTDLVELVEASARAHPEQPSVRWAGGELSYRRLDQLANRLAGELRALGVDHEARVGLYLPRSPELVVAMLAVLKAGGAFVPLDPDWPARRIAAVSSAASLGAVCTRSGHDVRLDLPVLVVDLEPPAADDAPPTPVRRIDGDQLAYVIYTSGSTGSPKGAMIRHRSIANRMIWQADLLDFGPGDSALFKAPLGFDISINEIFLPLTTGAKLVIAEPGQESDVEALVRLIAAERVTFCYLVSSMLAAMLELPGFSATAGTALRHVWCGGEALSPELFARFRSAIGATMYHGYGPAEATIGVTHEIYRPGLGRDGTTIGRPNPNTRVYVLDGWLRPTPPGVVGELYVGGLLLGRGYVADPKRTAERFVADPVGTGDRLYRTGDLASWLPDGRLRFAGRADNQVKVRGMRVEPEEVESVLAGHPRVGSAVVLALEASGATRLVACYTANAPVEPDELRGWLRERLAEYLVPAELVELSTLPSQASGKVDRAELTRRLAERPARATAIEEPATDTEKRVLVEFRHVLGRDDIGVTDDFFAVGGHSLLATRLVVRLRADGSRGLTVRALFDCPTVRELARHLDRGTDNTAGLSDAVLLPLRATGAGAPLFCVHPVSGLAQAYAGLLGPLPGRPVYGLQARSLAEGDRLPDDLEAMAADYVREIRSVQSSGPYHLLGWSLGGSVAHLMACQLVDAGESVATLAVLDSVPGRCLDGPGADRDWTPASGLAQLLTVSGYPVPDGELDPPRAAALVGSSDGPLAGFTADDLMNVCLSWRHSGALRASTDPVFAGELLVFEAAVENRDPGLAQLWRSRIDGEIEVHRVDATHWGMAGPEPLALVAARLRSP